MLPCCWLAVSRFAEALCPVRVYGHVVFERFCFLGPETSVCFRMFRVLLYLFLSLHSTPRGVFHVETRKKVVRQFSRKTAVGVCIY